MSPSRPLLKIALTVLALCALFASSANAELARQARADANASAFRAANVNIPVRDPGPPPGAEVLNYKFGPMEIKPGQNIINVDLQKERPDGVDHQGGIYASAQSQSSAIASPASVAALDGRER